MKTTWQLDSLYTGFDDPALAADLKTLEHLQEKYDAFIEAHLCHHNTPVETTRLYLDQLMGDLSLIRKAGAFGSLSVSVNSKNQEALALSNKVGLAGSRLTKATTAFNNWLKELEAFDDLFGKDPVVDEHRFYLTSLKDKTRYMLSTGEEVLLSKLRLTGSVAWETLQRKVSSELTGTVVVDGKEETLPIMSIRNLAFTKDPATRKAAYEAELAAYKKHEDVSAAALNGIKGEVLTVSEARGFESPLAETLYNSRMDRAILDAMIEAMEENLPTFRKYVGIKAKFLGHDGPMPFYDLFAPVSSGDADFTIEQARDFVLKHFGAFNPKLQAFAQKAFDKEWIDFEPRAGKVGGAFCSNLAPIGESRFLLNFTGKLKNVFTLAHELGHGYHGDCLRGESLLNTTYPMPLAETASIFCETIVRNAALKGADDTLQLSILESSLSGASQVVMDILSRYYFETAIFETRKDHPLSADEYKTLMLGAQKKAYGNCLDEDVLHPYMWLNKTHYYYAQRNFYNFPYAFGLLFARGLYALYEKEGDSFLPKYDQLLNATGKMSIQDVCMSVGIDPTQKAFWQASLDQIKEEVARYELLLK